MTINSIIDIYLRCPRCDSGTIEINTSNEVTRLCADQQCGWNGEQVFSHQSDCNGILYRYVEQMLWGTPDGHIRKLGTYRLENYRLGNINSCNTCEQCTRLRMFAENAVRKNEFIFPHNPKKGEIYKLEHAIIEWDKQFDKELQQEFSHRPSFVYFRKVSKR